MAPALDVRTLTYPAGDPAWVPYTYNVPDVVFTLAGQTASPRVSISGEQHFICTHLTAQVTAGTFRALIRRNLDSFSNQAIDASLMFGTGLRPYYLAAPFINTPSTNLGADLVAGGAQTVSLQFHGIQINTKDLELVRAGVPSLFLPNGYAISFFAYDVVRLYAASEREKMQIKTPGEYDFLLTELNTLSTGPYSSRMSWSGDVSLDDTLTPAAGYFGNAQFPGFVNPIFVPATSTLTGDNKDLSLAPNTIEQVWAGVRYPHGLKV
jgi:hypothetical protein